MSFLFCFVFVFVFFVFVCLFVCLFVFLSIDFIRKNKKIKKKQHSTEFENGDLNVPSYLAKNYHDTGMKKCSCAFSNLVCKENSSSALFHNQHFNVHSMKIMSISLGSDGLSYLLNVFTPIRI